MANRGMIVQIKSGIHEGKKAIAFQKEQQKELTDKHKIVIRLMQGDDIADSKIITDSKNLNLIGFID